MRFHIGFSKRIKLSTLLKFGGIFIAIFGLNSCVVHADSFVLLQNYSWCTNFDSTNWDSQGCSTTTSSNITTNTVNGTVNVSKPLTSYIQSLHKVGDEKHSEFFKYGGTSDCNTGSTISFDIDVFLNDVQEIFANNNMLDYESWHVGGLTRDLRGANIRGYYSWLSRYSYDTENKTGVFVGKNNYTGQYNACSFVSYGTNKSLRFRCSIDSGSTGYVVKIMEYNENGNFNARYYADDTSLPAFVTGIKITNITDPCKQYGTDQSSVVDAITDQTNDIMGGFQDIIDSNNNQTNSINSHIDGFKNDFNNNSQDIIEEQQETNDLLRHIIDTNDLCQIMYPSDFSNNGKLDINTGIVNVNSNYITSSFLKFKRIKEIKGNNYTICFYDSEKNKLQCFENDYNMTPNNSVYFRISFIKNNTASSVEFCGVNGFNDTLLNDDTSSSDNWLNNFSAYNYSQDLKSTFLFPLELLENVQDNYGVCTPYSLDFSSFTQRFGGFNYSLTMPCLGPKIQSLIGNDLYNTIDNLTAFSLFIYFCYHFYLKVHDLMSGNNGLAGDLRDITMQKGFIGKNEDF